MAKPDPTDEQEGVLAYLRSHAAAILDCLGIPYTGSNPLSLALCIDKIKVKKILDRVAWLLQLRLWCGSL